MIRKQNITKYCIAALATCVWNGEHVITNYTYCLIHAMMHNKIFRLSNCIFTNLLCGEPHEILHFQCLVYANKVIFVLTITFINLPKPHSRGSRNLSGGMTSGTCGPAWSLADPGGRRRRAPPPPQQDSILSFSHMFSPKSTHIGGWRPPNSSVPPPTGNPGSATDGGHLF